MAERLRHLAKAGACFGHTILRSRVANRYYQEVNLFKLGRMPALFVIDRNGVIRFAP